MTGVWILAGAVLIAVAFGLYRRATDGRFDRRRDQRMGGKAVGEGAGQADGSGRSGPVVSAGASPRTWHGHALGERATLVQFSSAFCAPCRVTRLVLEDVSDSSDGVVHIDIDAEAELALVRELKIMRTPTTLILDREGREVARAAGAPRKDQVLAALPNLT